MLCIQGRPSNEPTQTNCFHCQRARKGGLKSRTRGLYPPISPIYRPWQAPPNKPGRRTPRAGPTRTALCCIAQPHIQARRFPFSASFGRSDSLANKVQHFQVQADCSFQGGSISPRGPLGAPGSEKPPGH